MRSTVSSLILVLLILPVLASGAEHQWSRAEEVPGLRAAYGMIAGCYADGVFHVVTSDDSRNVIHVRKDGGQWVAPVMLAHHRVGFAPDLAYCDGKLHMAGQNKFKLWHSVLDGGAWSNPDEIPAMEARNRPRITAGDGVLHLTHGGMNIDRRRIFYAAEAGWGWGHDLPLPDQTGRPTSAMAVLGGRLHMVYVSKNSDTAWHTYRDRRGEWSPPTQIPGVETSRPLDLVAANNKLFCVFTVGDVRLWKQAPVAYCEYVDGNWDAPTTIEGYVCYGNPAAAVEPGLPQQVHLLLPSRVGVMHMWTTDEVKIAPVKMKTMQTGR